jgi:hypothetical protein
LAEARGRGDDPLCSIPRSLLEGTQAVYDIIQSGGCRFGRDDLPFVDLVDRFADGPPFRTLLKQINETTATASR